MRKMAFVGLAFLLLALGCIGGKSEQVTEKILNVEVKTTSVYAGTTVPVLVKIKNPYEVSMDNVVVEIAKDTVPAPHSVSEPQSISSIAPGTDRQVYLSIKTSKDITVSQPITPKVKMDFEGTTNFYFDMNIINASNPDLLTKEYTAYVGSNNAPVKVTPSNNDRIEVTKKTNWTIMLNVANADEGKILEIKDLTLTVPTQGIISRAWLEYGECKKQVYPSGGTLVLTLKSDNCTSLKNPDLLNPNAVLTLTLEVQPGESVTVMRVEGHLTYKYEMSEDLPTITIKKVG